MTVTVQMLLTVCPLIFLSAVVDAIGGGGGLISLPAYLLAGLSPAMASGSNKLSASLGTLIATGRYLKSGKVRLLPALIAAAGAFPGSYLGAELLKRTNPDVIRIIMIIAIPLMAVVLLLKKDTPAQTHPLTPLRLAGCGLLGLACGFYDGFFGPGTGTLLIMGLTYLIGMDMVTASGSAKLINLTSNVAALTSLSFGGNVLVGLAVPAAVFSIAGGYLGSWLAIRKGAGLIRRIMLGVLVLLIARLVFVWFFVSPSV